MKNVSRAFMFVSALLIGTCFPAAGSQIWGAGNLPCKTVSAGILTLPNSEHQIAWEHSQWVLGFLSAMAFSEPAMDKEIKGLDAERINKWVIDYCKDNPTNDLEVAATALIEDAISHKK